MKAGTSDEQSQRTKTLRERYRAFVESRLTAPGKRSPVRVVIGLLLLCSVVLIPIGLYLVFSGLRKRNPLRNLVLLENDSTDRAEAVMAFPLMVNSMLRSPGDAAAPGLFLVTFERDVSMNLIAEFGQAVLEPTGRGLSKADEDFLIRLMLDEEYQRSRRRLLPMSITKGIRCYACDLAIHPWYLPGRHISDQIPMIPCLAEPGDRGEIRAVPYWLAFDVPPPPWAENCPLMYDRFK